MLKKWIKTRAISTLKDDKENEYLICRNADIIRLRESLTQALTNDEELVQLLAKQLSYLHYKRRNVIAVLLSSYAVDRLVAQIRESENSTLINSAFQDTLNFIVANNGQVATLVRLPVYVNDKMDVSLHVVAEAKFE